MSHSKLPMLLFVVFFISCKFIPAQSFSYTGPTTIDFQWLGQSVTGTYNFTYYNIPNPNNLYTLAISPDDIIVGILNKTQDGTLPLTSTLTYNTIGSHIVTFTLKTLSGTIVQQQQITLNCRFMIRHQNNFSAGMIYVDNYSEQKAAPYDRPSLVSDNYLVGAIEQSDGTYNRVWKTSGTNISEWIKQPNNSGSSHYTYNKNTNYIVGNNDKDMIFQANLRKVYNINFKNNFINEVNGGTIIVNGTQYNSPSQNFPVIEGDSISATAQNQTVNGIDFTFTGWSDGSQQITRKFGPGDHTTYSANFSGKPNTANRSLHFNASNSNQPITVLWSEHPDLNVTQYQIWRKVNYKKQGVSSPALIGTLNRGTTSFVDYDYSGTNLGYTDYMLWYDVKPYYSINQTYSSDNYVIVFSNGMLAKQGKDNTGNINEIVSENKMENYPNPFNPSTVITYQIVNQRHVSLKVYDCLGKEIAELVNEEQNSGSYKVLFNVNNLGSGIYFYRIVANGYTETKKMIRMK